MEGSEALRRATAHFERLLHAVGPTDWTRPTPNPDWDVRYLVNHVVGGNRRYLLLLSGAPTAMVEPLRIDGHLGADPVADFRLTSDLVTACFGVAGVEQLVVHHRRGDRSGADLQVMRVLEHTLHGWDLAVATDGNDSLDPEVVAWLLERQAADPTLLPRAGYEPTDDVDNPDSAAHLLALTGRTPRESGPGR